GWLPASRRSAARLATPLSVSLLFTQPGTRAGLAPRWQRACLNKRTRTESKAGFLRHSVALRAGLSATDRLVRGGPPVGRRNSATSLTGTSMLHPRLAAK